MAVVVTITPTLDTSAYADGDVLFNPVEIRGILENQSETRMLHSVAVADASDQQQPFDLLFFNSSGVSLGTVNAAVSISDADTAKCIGRIQILASDYYDLGGADFADIGNISKLMRGPEGASAERSLWVGGVSRGTGTYAASALTLRLGFI